MSFGLSHEIRGRLFEFLLLLVVCGSITFSTAYINFQWFARDLETATAPGDTAGYLSAYLAPEDILRGGSSLAFRDYRLAVPLLAHLVPEPPEAAFRSARRIDTLGLAVFKFAVVTALFNFAASVLTYAICRWFQLPRLLSLLGSVLYSALTFVAAVNGIPHVDSVFFFAFGLGAYALLTRSYGVLLLTALVGTFVKEAIFLLGFLALLLPDEMRTRLRLIAVMIPGALVYVAVRYIILPGDRDYFASGTFVPLIGLAFHNLWTLNGLEWVFMGLDFLWLPLLWTLLRGGADRVLVRWSLVIPVLIGVTILGGSDHFARSLVLAYPTAIPLAMLGIQALLDRIESLQTESAPSTVQLERSSLRVAPDELLHS